MEVFVIALLHYTHRSCANQTTESPRERPQALNPLAASESVPILQAGGSISSRCTIVSIACGLHHVLAVSCASIPFYCFHFNAYFAQLAATCLPGDATLLVSLVTAVCWTGRLRCTSARSPDMLCAAWRLAWTTVFARTVPALRGHGAAARKDSLA